MYRYPAPHGVIIDDGKFNSKACAIRNDYESMALCEMTVWKVVSESRCYPTN